MVFILATFLKKIGASATVWMLKRRHLPQEAALNKDQVKTRFSNVGIVGKN